jgi:DNA-binding MurR/RpiR family transcriptional regulator
MSQTDRVSQLSPRRREIIRPAFENPRQFVLLSVRDMAKKLGTDPATTVRIARGLGFESYKEFQRYLHELSVVRATSLDTMQAGSPVDSSVNSLLRECLNQEVKNFRALYNALDLNRLEKVARRLWKARRILIIGGDAAACLVAYLHYHFTALALPVSNATAPGLVVHSVRNLGKEDVLIAVSFRRGLRMTIEGIQQAHKLGAYCIGITDTYISPVARFSDEFFLTPVDTTSFEVSYSAPMCLFNVLLSAMAEVQRTKTLQIVKKVAEEQRHGFRFYEE